MSGHELEFINDAFQSNWIAPIGPHVDAFEREFAQYIGVPHAAATSSGTAAIHLALLLLGVEAGDEVICSSFTFAGSAFPISHLGAIPVFVDSDEQSWNMDPVLLEKAIKDRQAKGKRVKGVILVHLYGQSADLDPIVDICNKYEVPLIEDAAEAVGTLYKGKHVGGYGRIGVFSFNGNKIMTTSGGGMFVSNDPALVQKARFLSTQARDTAPHYEHTQIGYNYRMSNVLAAIGRGQLKVIEERVAKRRQIFEYYVKKLSHLGLSRGVDSENNSTSQHLNSSPDQLNTSTPQLLNSLSFMPQAPYGRCNRWLTCIIVDPEKSGTDREKIRLALEKENIESRPLWKPMHCQPVFKDCPAYTNGVSEKLFRDGLCLPSGTAMTEDNLDRVCGIVRKEVSR